MVLGWTRLDRQNLPENAAAQMCLPLNPHTTKTAPRITLRRILNQHNHRFPLRPRHGVQQRSMHLLNEIPLAVAALLHHRLRQKVGPGHLVLIPRQPPLVRYRKPHHLLVRHQVHIPHLPYMHILISHLRHYLNRSSLRHPLPWERSVPSRTQPSVTT